MFPQSPQNLPGPEGLSGASPFGTAAGEIDIDKYLSALRRHWPLLLVFVFLATSAALIRYTLTPKEYMATAQVQIERKRLSVLALGQASYLEDWWNMEYYPTQYRLLRSRGLAERVVLNLRLDENSSFTGRESPQDLTGSPTLEDDKARLASLAARVRGRLRVDPVQGTQLVDLSYRSHDPKLAALIANGYAQAFDEWGIEKRNLKVGLASTLIDDQVQKLREEISGLQQKIDELGSRSELSPDPAAQSLIKRHDSLEQDYNAALGQLTSARAAYNARQGRSGTGLGSTSSDPEIRRLQSEVFELEGEYRTKLETYRPDWPEMVQLKKELDGKQKQLELMLAESARKSRDEAGAIYNEAERRVASLKEQLRLLTAEINKSRSVSKEYEDILATLTSRRQTLSELLQRQSETDVATRVRANEDSNIRLVDRAIVPSKPFRPLLQRDLATAFIAGLLLGIGCIALLEFLDRSIKSPEELEKIMGIPALAVIPDANQQRGSRHYAGYYSYGHKPDDAPQQGWRRWLSKPAATGDEDGPPRNEREIELIPHRSPRLAICEAYRSLRTALLLSSADELKVVALTSAEPGEGKTATTTNLGVVLSQLGRRVLIIDGDLRRPRLHKVFKKSNRSGLVNYLTGSLQPEQLPVETVVPNLYICPSGPIPPDPSKLLASSKMRDLLTLLRSRFDFVLIDTPPVLPVADAIVLGTMADGVVVCARHMKLRREDARACREQLNYNELRLLGAVLNRNRATSGRYSRYDYYGTYGQSREEREEAEAGNAA